MNISEEIADLNLMFLQIAKRVAETEDIESCRADSIELKTGLSYKTLQSLKKMTLNDIRELKIKLSNTVLFSPRLSPREFNSLFDATPIDARFMTVLRGLQDGNQRFNHFVD